MSQNNKNLIRNNGDNGGRFFTAKYHLASWNLGAHTEMNSFISEMNESFL